MARHQGGYQIPDWAHKLKDYYWMIRVQGRDKAKRRRYYRYVSVEKLRLAEMGINQNLIKAVCRYLSTLNNIHGQKFDQLNKTEHPQSCFNF